MIVDRFLRHVPVIEERIRLARLDTLVLGLGPTAWLFPWMKPALFAGMRLFGVNDGERITKVNDLVVLDLPIDELNQDSERHHMIRKTKADRLWIYKPFIEDWAALLPPDVLDRTKAVDWNAYNAAKSTGLEDFPLTMPPLQPYTSGVSPLGAATLAWQQGCRRIGILGCDMMPGHHSSHAVACQVDAFFTSISRQATKQGGLILNLSPCTSLQNFAAVSQSAFLSELTGGSVKQERSVFLSGASASTAPAQ